MSPVASHKFTAAKHEFILISTLAPHPEIQRRFEPAWAKKIAAEFDPDQFGELAVVRVGDRLYVFDGQHRLWAARQYLGSDNKVPCVVYSEMPVARQAELFLGRNAAKPVKALDKWWMHVKAGHEVETKIEAILARHGLRTRATRGAGTVQAVTALRRVYDRCGGEPVLDRVLAVLGTAWGYESDSFDAALLEGAGLLLHRFPEVSDKELSSKLAKSGKANRMIGAARDLSKAAVRMSVSRAMFERFVAIYNKGRRTQALAI